MVYIFDFDGTIADSRALVIAIYREIAIEKGLKILNDSELELFLKLPVMKKISYLKIPIYKIPKYYNMVMSRYKERVLEIRPFECIKDTLKSLSEAHELYILSSNKSDIIEIFLEKENMSEYFKGVYTSAHLFSKHKLIKQLLKENGLSKDECFYIGDEERDILAASKVGMRAVCVLWGADNKELLTKRNPYMIIETPCELKEKFR